MSDISGQHDKPPWVERIRPRPRWIRKIARGIVYLIGHSFARINVLGRENIPGSGPCIVAGNHFSVWEPPLMVYAIREPINILAAGDLNWPLSQSWALFVYGYIPTNRESFKPSTIREASRALDRNEFVGIFPEAGMNPDLELRPAKPGTVYLSALKNAPILPVGFSGFGEANRHWKNLQKPTFNIRIGKPFGPFRLSGDPEHKKDQMEEYGHVVMRRIAALLPPDWRGYYRNDPEVQSYELYPFEK